MLLYFINPDRVIGILGFNRLSLIDIFRDEAYFAIEAIGMQTVSEKLSSESFLEVGQQFDSDLLKNLKSIDFKNWIILIESCFDNLTKLLRRINLIYKFITYKITEIAEHNDEVSMMVLKFDSKIGEKIKTISKENCIELNAKLKESLNEISDYAQSFCAKLIGSRENEKICEKLENSSLVEFFNYCNDFYTSYFIISDRINPQMNRFFWRQGFHFVTKFHEVEKEKLNLCLKIEKWDSFDIVSHDFKYSIIQMIEKNIRFNDIQKLGVGEESEQKMGSYVFVNGEKFVVVNSVITLINSIMEYIECGHRIKILRIHLQRRILELLELFNSSTAQMVLGLGIRHFATSKIWTFRKILIASRCLKFVIVFLPIVKTNILKSDYKFCKDFNDIISLFNEHIVKINQKVISIMTEIIDSQLSKWMAKPPVPSAYFQTILLHLIQLHDNIQDVLPFYVLVDLFKHIQNIFEELLKKRLERLKIKNDGGPQHRFVSLYFFFKSNFFFQNRK